jgi:hypothetical protein
MTYACPYWELKTAAFAEQSFCSTGLLDRYTAVCKLHVTFKISYVCGCITKWCKQWSEVIHNHQNPNVHSIGQGKAIHRRCKGFKLGRSETYDH